MDQVNYCDITYDVQNIKEHIKFNRITLFKNCNKPINVCIHEIVLIHQITFDYLLFLILYVGLWYKTIMRLKHNFRKRLVRFF